MTQGQLRAIVTLIIAFLAGASASFATALQTGVNADNWQAVGVGIIVAAVAAGIHNVLVTWFNSQGNVIPLEARAGPGKPPWFHLKPGQICQFSGQYTWSRFPHDQKTCNRGDPMPPPPEGGGKNGWWYCGDKTITHHEKREP